MNKRDVARTFVTQAAMSAEVSYSRVVCVPGSQGVWEGRPRSKFRVDLQNALCLQCKTSFIQLSPVYQASACAVRQQLFEQCLSKARSSKLVVTGHSEGGARVLQALCNPRIAAKIASVILVSPAYALRSVGAVDVKKAVLCAQQADIQILVLDTEHGWGGEQQRYQWPLTRGILCQAIDTTPNWDRILLQESWHSLRRGAGDRAVAAVVSWLQRQ